MSLPTINDVQAIEPILTNLLVGYKQTEDRFVASRVFPGVPVDKDSGTFYVFTKKYFFTDEMQHRAPGDVYATSGFGVGTDTYKTLQWALAKPIADEERANSQVPMDLEEATVQWLAQKSLIRKERAFAADFMVTGVWDTTNTSATDWDDYSAGDPVANIQTAQQTINSSTGMFPNVLVVGLVVAHALENHPDILDRIKYTQAATAGSARNALAAVFDLEEILVAKANYNSANESSAMTGAAIIDDDALLVYRAPRPGIFVPSCGYTFNWAPGGGMGVVMRHKIGIA